jgi:hypothetical protein
MGQNRYFGMSLIRAPGRHDRLIPLVGDYLPSPSLGFLLQHQCSRDGDRTLDDTRKSSSKVTLLSLEFDGAMQHGSIANQASVRGQTAAYAMVLIEPRGSLLLQDDWSAIARDKGKK